MTYDEYGDNAGKYQQAIYKQDIEPAGSAKEETEYFWVNDNVFNDV